MIKAPFNFIPLENKSFRPEWADKISHDKPFKDGVSGILDLEIIAASPIFVRNGHIGDNKDAQFSVTPDGEYFIPGSSIKGAVRNVLEIMSFGKMANVQNKSFGKRDLQDSTYTSMMRNNHCGWLYCEGEKYWLEDHDKPKTISTKDLDAKIFQSINIKTDLFGLISNKENFKNDKKIEAFLKYYHIFRKKHPDAPVLLDDAFWKSEYAKQFLESSEYLLSDGSSTIVLTGQPGARYFDEKGKKPIASKEDAIRYCKRHGLNPADWEKHRKAAQKEVFGRWKGKGKEFLFPDAVVKKYCVDDIIDSFKTIHANSPDYELFWSKKLANGEKIPVFFAIDGGKVHSMGLSYLYKYPYEYSVLESIPQELKDAEGTFVPDMAECIFGNIGNSDSDALKGRVQFGAAFASGNIRTLNDVTLALNSPKPSYYPLYRRGKNWDTKALIAGRKVYVRWDRTAPQKSDNDKVNSTITPLDKGTIFTAKIRFFNLRQCELGALIAALTFLGDNGKKYKYSLGQGKPYGYGICEFKIKGGRYVCNDDVSGTSLKFDTLNQIKFMKEFVELMDRFNGSPWTESTSIKSLFAIAGTRKTPKGEVYMHMSNTKDENEFLSEKKEGNKLDPVDISFVELPDLSKLEESAREEAEKQREEARQKQEANRKEEEALERMNLLQIGTIVQARYMGNKKANIISPIVIDYEIQVVLSYKNDISVY